MGGGVKMNGEKKNNLGKPFGCQTQEQVGRVGHGNVFPCRAYLEKLVVCAQCPSVSEAD